MHTEAEQLEWARREWELSQASVKSYWQSMWEKSMHNPKNKATVPTVHHGDVDDAPPLPPRTAWSQDPWPGVRGTTTRPLPDVAWDPNLKTEDSVDIRPESPFTDADLSILTEAHGLVHGDRQAAYGHPAVDFGRTAALANVLLASKLKSDLGPEDIATLMVCVKLSRECHEHKRDNLVDACGYLECRERVLRFLGTNTEATK